MNRILLLLTLFTICCGGAAAQEGPPAWVSDGPYVGESEFSFELPFEVVANKLYVEVVLGGTPRRFVFDTGSPSMMSRDLATELNLEVVASTQGRDSHGTIVDTDIVQADFSFGEVTFRKVPVFVADFSKSVAVQCMVGDGVLGSELLPLCTWQIDMPQGVLRCNTDVNRLDHIDGVRKVPLYDFGYPHAPFLDIRLAKDARSKAMFDTGASGYFAISPPDFEGAKRAGGVDIVKRGFGSLGGSLGGQAPDRDQVRSQLKSLAISDVSLGRVDTHVRETPPSLIGASILEHFVVTLDMRSESAYLDNYNDAPLARPSFGFSLGFDEAITVSLVWEDSPAARAGLRAGQQLNAINGAQTEYSCKGIKKAMRAMEGDSIEISYDGGIADLVAEPIRR